MNPRKTFGTIAGALNTDAAIFTQNTITFIFIFTGGDDQHGNAYHK